MWPDILLQRLGIKKKILLLNNNKHHVGNMAALLLFEDFVVIYVFSYTHEAPMFAFFFATDFTSAQ